MRPAAPHMDNFLSTQERAVHKSGGGQEGLCGGQLAVLVASPQKQIAVSCTHDRSDVTLHPAAAATERTEQ